MRKKCYQHFKAGWQISGIMGIENTLKQFKSQRKISAAIPGWFGMDRTCFGG